LSGTAPLLIRRAVAADLERIAWLEEASFAEPWTPALLHDELAHPASLLLVAARGAAPPEGYACFRRVADEAELLRVAVAPEARGRRVGSALIAAGLVELARAGVASCHLEVRTDNASAQAVYRRLGFAPSGRRRGYYRDGGDALVFTLGLPPAPARPPAGPEPARGGAPGSPGGPGARLDPA
jgi:ribosomal-protein-alanine N-acetyltransferase